MRCGQISESPSAPVRTSETSGISTRAAASPSTPKDQSGAPRRARRRAGKPCLGAAMALVLIAPPEDATGEVRSVVEPDLVDELARRLPVLRHVGDRERVGVEGSEGGDRLVEGDAGFHGILEVHIGVDLLGG